MRNENERFWSMIDLDDGNMSDLRKSVENGDLVGLVDEEAGGIIAYVLDKDRKERNQKIMLDLLNEVK